MKLITLTRALRRNSPTWVEVGTVPLVRGVSWPELESFHQTLYGATASLHGYRGDLLVVTTGPFVAQHRKAIDYLRPVASFHVRTDELRLPVEGAPSQIWRTALDLAHQHLGPSAYDWLNDTV